MKIWKRETPNLELISVKMEMEIKQEYCTALNFVGPQYRPSVIDEYNNCFCVC